MSLWYMLVLAHNPLGLAWHRRKTGGSDHHKVCPPGWKSRMLTFNFFKSFSPGPKEKKEKCIYKFGKFRYSEHGHINSQFFISCQATVSVNTKTHASERLVRWPKIIRHGHRPPKLMDKPANCRRLCTSLYKKLLYCTAGSNIMVHSRTKGL